MEIVYKKLTEAELGTFIDMRISQLTEEYETEGKEVSKNVDLKSTLFGGKIPFDPNINKMI